MVKSINFVVLVVDGRSKTIQSSLKMNHKIEILTTPSCENCKIIEKILDGLNISYNIIDVTKKTEYLEKYPIFTAPGVVINDKLEFVGVPKKQELVDKLLHVR